VLLGFINKLDIVLITCHLFHFCRTLGVWAEFQLALPMCAAHITWPGHEKTHTLFKSTNLVRTKSITILHFLLCSKFHDWWKSIGFSALQLVNHRTYLPWIDLHEIVFSNPLSFQVRWPLSATSNKLRHSKHHWRS